MIFREPIRIEDQKTTNRFVLDSILVYMLMCRSTTRNVFSHDSILILCSFLWLPKDSLILLGQLKSPNEIKSPEEFFKRVSRR